MNVKSESGAELDLVIEPQSDRYDPLDDRWRGQISEFYQGLHKEVDGVRHEVSPVAGTKGGLETIILALGSAGAFTVALEFFRAWLRRDRTRSLKFTFTSDGKEEVVTIHGDAIDMSPVQTLAEKLGDAVASRIEGTRWPKPSTEPS